MDKGYYIIDERYNPKSLHRKVRISGFLFLLASLGVLLYFITIQISEIEQLNKHLSKQQNEIKKLETKNNELNEKLKEYGEVILDMEKDLKEKEKTKVRLQEQKNSSYYNPYTIDVAAEADEIAALMRKNNTKDTKEIRKEIKRIQVLTEIKNQ